MLLVCGITWREMSEGDRSRVVRSEKLCKQRGQPLRHTIHSGLGSIIIHLQSFAAAYVLLIRFASQASTVAAASGYRCGPDQPIVDQHCPGDLCCNARSGWCGNTLDHCDPLQCLTYYGKCGALYAVAANDSEVGKCGPGNICQGALCCSNNNYCGSTQEYCSLDEGCRVEYGICWSPSANLSTGAKVGIALGAVALVGGVAAAFWYYKIRKTAKRYTYKQLYDATDGFKEANKLGVGTYGEVYRGTIKGKVIAVKKLKKMRLDSKAGGEVYEDTLKGKLLVKVKKLKKRSLGSKTGVKAFESEIQTRTERLNHKNLMEVKGFCVRNNDRFLVYEYMEEGSLKDWLFPSEAEQRAQVHLLEWPQRFDIVKGVAEGLIYLHHSLGGDIKSIVHGDIKPDNILLSRGLVPKLADFGMAKLIRISDETEVISPDLEEGDPDLLRGTIGYRAPAEAALAKDLGPEADVFSFGIVLLEVVSGRRVFSSMEDALRYYLPVLAIDCFLNEPEDLSIVLDPKLELLPTQKVEVRRVLRVALWCLQFESKNRPDMKVVLDLLRGLTLDESVYQHLPPDLPGMRDKFEAQMRDYFEDPQAHYRLPQSSNTSGGSQKSNSQFQPWNILNSNTLTNEPQLNGYYDNEVQVEESANSPTFASLCSDSQPLSDLSSGHSPSGQQKKGVDHPD